MILSRFRHAMDTTAVSTLLPVMTVVLTGFLVIGLALPVLPLHVHDGLGLGAFVVGLVTGSQFAASLISRVWAGDFADRKGPKRGVITGLLAASISGLLYLLSLQFIAVPIASVTILLLGRALLGAAESFIITGAVSWGLVLLTSKSAGKVIAWVGMAMFAALAVGAPIGTALYEIGGFIAIALATTLVPLATLALALRMKTVPASQSAARRPFMSVAAAVWMPGLGAAFGSIGFGAILAFSSLFFAEREWSPVWLAFTAYAVSLIAARLFFGHLPDRLGGARVALISVLIEAAGLALIWLAPGPVVAAVGAMLTGLGYSLVYPGFGVEAVRRAPPESRGLVMGIYTAFLDVALGFGTPALGLVGAWGGLRSVFMASTLIVLCATVIAVPLIKAPVVQRVGSSKERV
jgi:MFS family permease